MEAPAWCEGRRPLYTPVSAHSLNRLEQRSGRQPEPRLRDLDVAPFVLSSIEVTPADRQVPQDPFQPRAFLARTRSGIAEDPSLERLPRKPSDRVRDRAKFKPVSDLRATPQSWSKPQLVVDTFTTTTLYWLSSRSSKEERKREPGENPGLSRNGKQVVACKSEYLPEAGAIALKFVTPRGIGRCHWVPSFFGGKESTRWRLQNLLSTLN
jgi:hypothetical protein